ncbi:MAG TPA: type I methionyl aminopeptidase [Clostridiaceae bacterium]|nr:type I methionyl aminopeptidase [Clostridiaceae bacterium]
MITIKSAEEIEIMKEAGWIVAEVFRVIEPYMIPGVSTAQIDSIAEELILDSGAIPSFKGVPGVVPFPAATCISIDDEVVHGIPRSDRILKEGQIVSVDVGAKIHGMHGDAARTWPIGTVKPELLELISVTEACFWAGLKMAKAGNRIGDISAAVQSCAEKSGFGVVRDLCGHGVGHELHEEPNLPNFGKSGYGMRLKAGMTLALEPMITLGDYHIRQMNDGWTIVTSDGKPAAHYENSFAVTDDGPIVFTMQDNEHSV